MITRTGNETLAEMQEAIDHLEETIRRLLNDLERYDRVLDLLRKETG